MLSDNDIIGIRKTTRAPNMDAWADTMAFARAIEEAVLAQLASDILPTLVPESLKIEGPWKRYTHGGTTYLNGLKPIGSDAAIFIRLHSNGNFDSAAAEEQFSLDLERMLNGLAK